MFTPNLLLTMHMKLLLFYCVCMCMCSLNANTTTTTTTGYNRYLVRIFQKYGNGSLMTFEGLEHLMHNLGLGEIEFETSHSIEEHRPSGYKISNNTIDSMDLYLQQQMITLLPEEQDYTFSSNYNLNETSYDVHMMAEEQIDNDNNTQARNDILLTFKEMHDPKHRHTRDSEFPLDENECLSPKSILNLIINFDKRKSYKMFMTTSETPPEAHKQSTSEEYNSLINRILLTPVGFMKLCPALLSQIDQQVCVQPLQHHVHDIDETWNAWIYASASVFILSASGLLGIFLVPLMKTAAYQEILKFLVAVAVGTLSGDALMHLLPHALHISVNGGEHHGDSVIASNTHNHQVIWICACAFFSTLFMYIIEILLPIMNNTKKFDCHKNSNNHQHGHDHIHQTYTYASEPSATAEVIEVANGAVREVREMNVMLNEKELDEKKVMTEPLSPVAFMVVIGDGLHNLTDGLAIGAAFAADPVTGFATAFAVLCHELPHELGDFALLLQTGVAIRRVIYLNILSSILSFVGMFIGLLITRLHSSMSQWIYAATAGSFLYIALSDLIPTMIADKQNNWKNSLIEVFGILAGGIIMILIALNEHDLHKLFKTY